MSFKMYLNITRCGGEMNERFLTNTQQVANDVQRIEDFTTNRTSCRHHTNCNPTQATVGNRIYHDDIPNQSSWATGWSFTHKETRRQERIDSRRKKVLSPRG